MFETVKDWVVIHKPACKGNPWRTNNMMSAQTLETDDERKSFITSFRDGWYKNQGFDVAERSVNNINAGTLYFDNPAIYMNSLADQDDCMLAIAIYLADCFYTAPTIKLREDYLSDKFIVRLNAACEYLGLPPYINGFDEEKSKEANREANIVYDEPSYIGLPENTVKIMKEVQASRADIAKKHEEQIAKNNADIAKHEEARKKKIEEALKKMADKEAKKANKKAEREAKKEAKKAEKAEEKTTDDIEDAVVVELDKPQRNRETSTKAAKSTTTNKAGNKKGGTGKTDDSSDSGDPDPAPSKTNLDEIIPLEKVVPIHIIDDEEERKRLLAENETELQKLGFVKDALNGGIKVTSEATKQIADIADSINNGELPSDKTIQAALDAAEKELQQRQQQQMQPIDMAHVSGRFPAAEIGTRTDLQLIQDGLNVACSNIAGVTATVTPKEGIKDQYNVMIASNGAVVDTFTAHGSRMFGKGVPVLEGYVDVGGGTLVDYFVPIHNPAAVRENIFRRVDIRNINGQLISTPKGTNLELAKAVELSIWKDHALLDYLDLTTHAFENDNEAYAFFHYAALAINEIEKLLGGRDKLSIYRVTNYKAYDKFDLVSDALAYGSRAPYACNTERGRVVLNLPRENNIAANVSGNKLHVVQPDGKATDFILPA